MDIKTKDKAGTWNDASHEEITETDMWKEWICLRTKFTLKYHIDSSKSCKQQLLQSLEATKSKLCASDKPIVTVDGTEIVLKKDNVFVGIGKNTKVSAVLNQSRNGENSDGPKSDLTQFKVINFTISSNDETIDDISAAFGSE